MPKYYTWNQSTKKCMRRKQGKPVPGYPGVYSTDAIGRIYSVHLSNDECFIYGCYWSMCVAQHNFNIYEQLMVNCVDLTEKPVIGCNC
jgi:hypothetical protein